jgi:hypothetical protein
LAYELEEFWRREPDPKTEAGDPSAALRAGSEGAINCSPGRLGAHVANSPSSRSPSCREPKGGGSLMRVVYERCCGLDVHKKTVVACVMTPEGQETRTFGTMTQDLLALSEWLEHWEVTHVAMESTGVYWKPLFSLLRTPSRCWW